MPESGTEPRESISFEEAVRPHAVDAPLDLDWSLPAQVLSEFLVPPRVQAAMKECDTNDDGELDRDEWKALSDRSLEAILERHALARGNDDEFIDEFLDMAVIVYDLIDEDMNGTLSKEELVKACGEDEDVIEFVVKCSLQCITQIFSAHLAVYCRSFQPTRSHFCRGKT